MCCQLEYLRHSLQQCIRRALDELPETLDETYGRTLEEIGKHNWEYAHRLFQCVAAASRPLRVEELAEFLAFDFDSESIPIFREDWREDPAHAVRSTCPSLLSVVDVDGSPVIQFAHFSVKEYLTSNRLAKAKDTISRFYISMAPAHTIVANACIGLLLHIDENITKVGLEKFSLVEYAAEHWVGHAQFDNVLPNIQDGMKRLFDPNNHHLSVWVWLYNPESPEDRYDRPDGPSRAGATGLHYAAFCGLHDAVKFLIIERFQDVNVRGLIFDETPLVVASRQGHFEVARLLLEHGAHTEIRDSEDWSALELASAWGHAEVVQLLLEHGADVDSVRKNNTTALHVASTNGQLAASRVLLEHGADANAKRTDNVTPLHCTSDEGVARVLLEHGADANAKRADEVTPLHRAFDAGVALVLIKYGADTNAQDGDNRTPLHWAAERGRTEVTRVLLENGSDPNARESKNRTPLHLASMEGCFDVVRLLLQRGIDIHARDNMGETPFQAASRNGHHDVMELLLEHGAEDHRR